MFGDIGGRRILAIVATPDLGKEFSGVVGIPTGVVPDAFSDVYYETWTLHTPTERRNEFHSGHESCGCFTT